MKKIIFLLFLLVLCVVSNQIQAFTGEQFSNLNKILLASEDFSHSEFLLTIDNTTKTGKSSIQLIEDQINNSISRKNMSNTTLSVSSIVDLTSVDENHPMKKQSTLIDDPITIFLITFNNSRKQDILELMKNLNNLDNVIAAEPNYNLQFEDLSVPNDPHFNLQWGLDGNDGANIVEAWSIMSQFQQTAVRVGIFEKGLDDSHNDLNVIPGNLVSSDKTHGTHVAGIIGGIKNNNLGISGVASVEIALLDRGDEGYIKEGNAHVFVDSLSWAFHNSIRIVNCSFRFISNNQIMDTEIVAHREAIKLFEARGGVVIAAAGNDYGINIDNNLQFPASYGNKVLYSNINNVITVGSLESYSTKSDFSNVGLNTVRVYAPGSNILSTIPYGDTPDRYHRWADGYAYTGGTSMAAPFVTGVVALLKSLNPNLSPATIINIIINNGEHITISTNGTSHGSRRLNAARVIANALYDLTFTGSNGLVINEIKVPISGTFIIPQTLFGRTVTSIVNNAFENITTVTEFAIPHTVTSISQFAFNNVGNAVIRFLERDNIQNISGVQFFSPYWNPQGRPVRFGTNSFNCTHSNYYVVDNLRVCIDCHNRSIQSWRAPILDNSNNMLTNTNGTIVDVFVRYKTSTSSPFTAETRIITNLMPDETFSLPSAYLIGGEAQVRFKQPGQTLASAWTRVTNPSIFPVKPTFIGNRTIRNDSSMAVVMRVSYVDTSGGSSDGPDMSYIIKQGGVNIVLQPGQTYRISNHYFDYWYGFLIRFETINQQYQSDYLAFGFNGGWISPLNLFDSELE